VQQQSAASIQRHDQILAASEGFEETPSTQTAREGASTRILYHVWSGDYYAFDALTDRGVPEINQAGFYFWKLWHGMCLNPAVQRFICHFPFIICHFPFAALNGLSLLTQTNVNYFEPTNK